MRFRYPQPGNEDEFEEFCARYYRHFLKRATIVRYGKRGEEQDGIDLVDQLAQKPVPVVQCKLHEPKAKLSPKEVRRDVATAEKSKHDIDRFIVATTAGKNRAVQDAVMRLNARPASERRFTVEVDFWEDICARLAECPRSIADFIVYGKQRSEPDLGISFRADSRTFDDVDDGTIPGDKLFPEIQKLFDEHKIEAAEHEIAKLPTGEETDNLTPDLQYAILRLRGKLALEQLRFDEAARLFQLAYEARPSLERAPLNHILALQLTNRHSDAYAEAASMLNEGCALPGAVSLLIRSAHSYEQIIAFRANIDAFQTDEEVSVALAQRLIDLRHFEEATYAANRALDVCKESAHAHMVAAMVAHQTGIDGDWHLRSSRLEQALHHYSEALRLARRDKYSGLIPEILTNRARVSAFFGRCELAAQDYRAAIDVATNPCVYAPDATSYFLSVGDTVSARQLVSLLDSSTVEGQFLKLVIEYTDAEPNERQACILAMAAVATRESKWSTQAMFFAVQWAIEIGDCELADSLSDDEFLVKHPFQGNTLRAWIQLERGNRENATKIAKTARGQSSTSAHKQELAVLARVFNRLGYDEDALPFWEQVSIAGVLDENCRQLLSCAERLERHDVLIKVCTELRECNSHDKFTRNLEMQLLSDCEWVRDLEIEKNRGRGTSWIDENGKLVLHEVGPKEIEDELRQVVSIHDTITAKCIRKSSVSIASLARNDERRTSKRLDTVRWTA